MQRHKGIGIIPMPARLGKTVHDNNIRVSRLQKQLIGKGHAHGAAADNQVIR